MAKELIVEYEFDVSRHIFVSGILAVRIVLSAISFKIYEMRKYLVLSLVISIIAIPIANFLVIQRDRNRNEMYGEAFWIYGFSVYDMTDSELAEALPEEWGYNDGLHTLPGYLGNITYEYPIFGLIFFAIATWMYPGVNDFQGIWLNFLLILVFNLNLVLIAILLRDKLTKKNWARYFFAGYFIYGLIMSAGGGKLEPIVDCLFLMALVLHQEGQNGKAMITLGLSFQTKIYSIVALPVLFISSPLSIIWFIVSLLMTIIPFTFLGANFESLIMHFLNTADYSGGYIVNPMYPGFGVATPDFVAEGTYIWLPALIPLVIYGAFMLYTIPRYLPQKDIFMDASWHDRLHLLTPFYVYLLPGILFVFRWVMPWYLFWLGGMIFLFDNDEHAVGYLKEITIVGFVYTFGAYLNYIYFLDGPLPDFFANFPLGWATLIGFGVMAIAAVVAFIIWSWTFDRRDRRFKILKEAEDRGELVI